MKNLSINQIRELFIKYFESRGHKHIPSSPVVPYNDSTLLFTNAGMVQFKDIFTGMEKSDFKTAVTSQKCIRAGGKHNDLENVGYTARHHTFFEMLGNFSFGDYFKREAITYAWDFLINYLEIPKDTLYVTVYHNDDEAFNLWKEIAKLDDSKIIRIATKDNFWEMGDSGPCGPCSEIFYDYGADFKGGLPGSPEQDDGERYIEIWNLVFMQFEKINGELVPLPKKSVDTGMGLERIAAVCQNVHDNYQTDLFQKIINKIFEITKIKFTNDLKDLNYICARVIADHLRSASFLIADGVLPGNNGRNYVLKRIIRRATIYLYKMGYRHGLIYKLVPTLVEIMSGTYKELSQNQSLIENTIQNEEESFFATLERGFKQFDDVLNNLDGEQKISGAQAFKLYDTFGLPLDITIDIAKSHNLEVDIEGFENKMNKQKELAKASWVGDKKYNSQNNEMLLNILEKHGETKFTGYENNKEEECILIDIFSQDDKTFAIFDRTPCYAESGGQVGDCGEIKLNNKIIAKVIDTRKINGLYLHEIQSIEQLAKNNTYSIVINVDERRAIQANHTATHLLHKVLKMVLGENTNQKGSLVESKRLRFDFNCPSSISKEKLKIIENLVNEEIENHLHVTIEYMSREEAIKKGSMALFEEKYGNEVRVVSIGGDFSIELCGGTHVSNTSEILGFKVISETLIASGIRRIEAYTHKRARLYIEEELIKYEECERKLKEENQKFKKELDLFKKESLRNEILNKKPENGIMYYNSQNQDNSILRSIAMELSHSENSIGLIANFDSEKNTTMIFLSIGKNFSERNKANEVLKKIAEELNFKPGGGNQAMASTNCEGFDFEKFKKCLAKYIVL